jgi:DNA primase
MGTALTPEQTERLRRLTSHAILCYDGDAPGRAATRGALVHLLAHGFEARVARLPASEDPDDVLRREGPDALARAVDEAPDALDWLLSDVRPTEEGISAAERRNRVDKILEILAAIPDRILRYEEHRRLSSAVSIPVDVLWGSRPGNREGGSRRLSDAGTRGNSPVLSIPPAERGILKGLLQGGELKSLVLRSLDLDWVSDQGVKRLVAALSSEPAASETVDFQAQIADLTEEDRNLISSVALEDSLEPTAKGVAEHLRKLETSYLDERSRELQSAIGRAQGETRPHSEIDDLIREKQEIQRRIAGLTRARKG